MGGAPLPHPAPAPALQLRGCQGPALSRPGWLCRALLRRQIHVATTRLKLPLDSRGLISYIMLSIDCGYGLGGGNFDRVPIDTAVSKPGGLGPVTAVVLIVVETWWGGAGGALLARS